MNQVTKLLIGKSTVTATYPISATTLNPAPTIKISNIKVWKGAGTYTLASAGDKDCNL